MKICRPNLCSVRGLQRFLYQILCSKGYQCCRLVVSILLIQVICGLWLVYRLKQPHKRVRSLIKHPYHLFSKSQFKQKADDLICSPDSQEEEASQFGKITELSLAKYRGKFCTRCLHHSTVGNTTGSRSIRNENVVSWKRQLVAHRTFQQTACEEERSVVQVLLLNASEPYAISSVQASLVAYTAAVLWKAIFLIAGPKELATELSLGHRHLDWRVVGSECGRENSVNLRPKSCRDVFSAVKVNMSHAEVIDRARGVGLDCVQALLSFAKKAEVPRARAHAFVRETFKSIFSFPLSILHVVNRFLDNLKDRPFVPVSTPAPPSNVQDVKNLVCIVVGPDLHKTKLGYTHWRCARFLEMISGGTNLSQWLLVGSNRTQLKMLAREASHYLQCSGKMVSGMHAVSTWVSPFPDGSALQQMSQLYMLSRCTAHISFQHDSISQLASAVAGRQYMSVKVSEGSKEKSTKSGLQEVCQLDYGL